MASWVVATVWRRVFRAVAVRRLPPRVRTKHWAGRARMASTARPRSLVIFNICRAEPPQPRMLCNVCERESGRSLAGGSVRTN